MAIRWVSRFFPSFWPYGETAAGYREEGYFPEAFVNMLALLGWNPGTEQEIFSMEELIAGFSIERVGKSGSRFDPEKAKWFNSRYFQMKSNEELAELFMPIVEEKGFSPGHDTLVRIVSLVKERVGFVKELWNEADFFFVAPDSYDPDVVRKRWNADSPLQMRELREVVQLWSHLPRRLLKRESRSGLPEVPIIPGPFSTCSGSSWWGRQGVRTCLISSG